MSELKISKVVSSIKIGSDGLVANGAYLILNSQVPKTGKINVRCAGTFGPATISVGWLDGGVFTTELQANGSPADFTANFALQFNCGEHVNVSDGPAIQVAAMDATTDLKLTISSID